VALGVGINELEGRAARSSSEEPPVPGSPPDEGPPV